LAVSFAKEVEKTKMRILLVVLTTLSLSPVFYPLLAKGAQKIDLAFWYEFQGKKLNAKPLAIDFALASIAGVPARFKTDVERLFSFGHRWQRSLNGNRPTQLYRPDPLGYLRRCCHFGARRNKRMIAASSSITIRIGRYTFSLTRSDLQSLQDFNTALESLVQQ
jgi:hypothetical protein